MTTSKKANENGLADSGNGQTQVPNTPLYIGLTACMIIGVVVYGTACAVVSGFISVAEGWLVQTVS